MALPFQAVIHELSEEVMNFNQLTSFYDGPPEIFQPWDEIHGWTTHGRYQLNQVLLFLGYWTASLKRNTEWSGQETTSQGRFYSTLGTIQISILGCSTDFIYNHEELRSRSSLNFPREIKWSKNKNR